MTLLCRGGRSAPTHRSASSRLANDAVNRPRRAGKPSRAFTTSSPHLTR